MHSSQSRSRRGGSRALLTLFLFAAAAIVPDYSRAAGSLAVALPPDVANGGFSYGFVNNVSDASTADSKALDSCRTTKDASTNAKLRALCKVIVDYHDQCVAVAMDPQDGTPGVGWSIASDLHTAESHALAACRDTDGPHRAAACVVDHSQCDGTAK